MIVSLKGDARVMPWNSSKSDISTKHEVFQALHDWLNQVVKDYAALSRIWMGEWPDKVFQHGDGAIVEVPIADFPAAKKSYLPPMPKSRPRYGGLVIEANSKVVSKKPWTRGLYEGVTAADLISKQELEQRNRIALIVLDITIEIAFKEFLVNDSGTHTTRTRRSWRFSQRATRSTQRSRSTSSCRRPLGKRSSTLAICGIASFIAARSAQYPMPTSLRSGLSCRLCSKTLQPKVRSEMT